MVKTQANSQEEDKITRTVDITFCMVWHLGKDIIDIIFTHVILIIPILFGPMLTSLLTLAYCAIKCKDNTSHPDDDKTCSQLGLLHVLAWLALGSYTLNLYLVEGVLFNIYNFSIFEMLLLKYVVGYADLIYVPIVIIIMDKDIREGVVEIYRQKRRSGSDTDISDI